MRNRLWVLVAAGVLGAVLAFVVTHALVGSAKPGFEASAAYVVEVSSTGSNSGQRSGNAASSGETEPVELVLDRAIDANSDVIDARLGQVTYDERSSELRFIAKAREPESAIVASQGMRSAYLAVTNDQLVAARSLRLDEIVSEAGEILAQVQASEPPTVVVTAVPDDVQARMDLLLSLESALSKQYTSLEVDIVLANAGDDRVGTPEEVQKELDYVTARLDEVTAEISLLAQEYELGDPRARGTTGGTADQDASTGSRNVANASDTDATPDNVADVWTLNALEAQYSALSNEYRELYLTPVVSSDDILPEPIVRDLTPNYGTRPLNALLGLLAAVLIAFGAVVAENAVRRKVLDQSDLDPIPVLASAPTFGSINRAKRESSGAHSSHGRSTSLRTRRINGIRQLRNSIVSSLEGSATRVIGFAGVSASRTEVFQLAVDTAARLSAADRRVVVLVLDFEDETGEGASPSVSSVWSAIRVDGEAGAENLRQALSAGKLVGSVGISVLPAGNLKSDPTDLAHTRAFRSILEICLEDSELLLAVLPDVDDPATRAFLYRLDAVVAVSVQYASSRKKIENLRRAAGQSGTPILGAVLLAGQIAPPDERDANLVASDSDEKPAGERIRSLRPSKWRNSSDQKAEESEAWVPAASEESLKSTSLVANSEMKEEDFASALLLSEDTAVATVEPTDKVPLTDDSASSADLAPLMWVAEPRPPNKKAVEMPVSVSSNGDGPGPWPYDLQDAGRSEPVTASEFEGSADPAWNIR